MGCDIHIIVQRRSGDSWENIDLGDDNPIEWRNYEMFAVFAGVRNGYEISPIAEPRGLPSDIHLVGDSYFPCDQHNGRVLESKTWTDKEFQYWQCDDCQWMGDHSWTWLSAKEVIEYDWAQTCVEGLVMKWSVYVDWVQAGRKGFPDSFSRGISGHNIVVVDESEIPDVPVESLHEITIEAGKRVYVYVEQPMPVSEAVRSFYATSIPWLQSLGDPSTVRLVMGFDS